MPNFLKTDIQHTDSDIPEGTAYAESQVWK